jgi:hypothetical protein
MMQSQSMAMGGIPIPAAGRRGGLSDHRSTASAPLGSQQQQQQQLALHGHGNPHADGEGGSSGSSETITSPTSSLSRQRRPRSRKDKEKRFTCDHPGCDKTYTRAEHLTRHQLNRTTSTTPTSPAELQAARRWRITLPALIRTMALTCV